MLFTFSLFLFIGALINGILNGFTILNSVYIALPGALCAVSAYMSRHKGLEVKLGKFKLGAGLVALVACGIAFVIASNMFAPISCFTESAKINESAKLILKGKEKQAEKILKKVCEKNQNNPLANLNLGVIYLKESKPELVKQYLDIAQQKLYYDENLWYNYGLMYNQQKDYANALKCFEKALQLNPNMTNAAVYAGTASYKMRALKRSIYHLEYASLLKPDSPEILMHLGRAHYQLMNYPQAEQAYKSALELKPKKSLEDAINEQMTLLKSAKGGENP